MKKWFDEEYVFEIEVTGFLRGESTERYCRNGSHGLEENRKRLGAIGFDI